MKGRKEVYQRLWEEIKRQSDEIYIFYIVMIRQGVEENLFWSVESGFCFEVAKNKESEGGKWARIKCKFSLIPGEMPKGGNCKIGSSSRMVVKK